MNQGSQPRFVGIKAPGGFVMINLPNVTAVFIEEHGNFDAGLRLRVHTTGGQQFTFDGKQGREFLDILAQSSNFADLQR